MKARRLIISAIVLGVAALMVAGGARASKEKFVRTKPHVNIIGPISLMAQTLSVRAGVLVPAVQLAGMSRPGDQDRECRGMFDVRLVDANDPAGEPLAETAGIRLEANSTLGVDFSPRSDGTRQLVYAVVVARDLVGLNEPSCVLRGQVEIAGAADGQVMRSLPIRPEDFVAIP